jgi:hypothetical protein
MDEYNEELHHEEQAGPEGEVNDEKSFSTSVGVRKSLLDC